MVDKVLLAHEKKVIFWVTLTVFLKAFDYIGHDMLIAKLNAYGFYQNALNVIYTYLFERSQKTKKDFSFSDLLNIL